MGFHEFISRAVKYVRIPKGILVGLLALFPFAVSAQTVTIDWVAVGDPGNACDPQPHGCFGSVPYTYWIGKYEVTNAQYAEFLNAVAETDTYYLYHVYMGQVYNPIGSDWLGGITRSGSSGSYEYSTIPGREDMPVNWTDVFQAMRFANWLHNGQPTGAQDSSTTEDGAYTFTGATSVGPRNPGATIFLPSNDEWHKAAYYDALSTSYFDYPAGSDTETTCALPGATPNTANCGRVVLDFTDVGSYAESASPSGTFDQGGSISEWIATPFMPHSAYLKGGDYGGPSYELAASDIGDSVGPGYELRNTGFRVASLPEPAPECSDTLDNDGDGHIDWNGGPLGEPADPGCADDLDVSEKDDTGVYPCDDGAHNDADGLADYPSDPGCWGPFGVEDPPCDDGLDNDGDLLIDFGSDPGCMSAWDPLEGRIQCGLGIELVPALGALLWLLRRRRHPRS